MFYILKSENNTEVQFVADSVDELADLVLDGFDKPIVSEVSWDKKLIEVAFVDPDTDLQSTEFFDVSYDFYALSDALNCTPEAARALFEDQHGGADFDPTSYYCLGSYISWEDYAAECVDELGFFGDDLPENLRVYIDIEKLARDLSYENYGIEDETGALTIWEY